MAALCQNVQVQLQAGSDRTLYATWTCVRNIPKKKPATTAISKYKYIWQYDTGQGVWFNNNYEETTGKIENCTYNAPSNAARVRFRVKALSKAKTKKTTYFTDSYTGWVEYLFSETPLTPDQPSAPDVSLSGLTITASLDNIDDSNTGAIEFEIVQNDTVTVQDATECISFIQTGHAAFSLDVAAGNRYKVRARGCRLGTDNVVIERGPWSQYSSNVYTRPSTPPRFTSFKTLSTTSVQFTWDAIPSAATYNIEYATDPSYFDVSSEVQSATGITGTTWTISGLSTGATWYFRLNAENSSQETSGWSEIQAVTVGTAPAAPTTWSSTTTAIVNEPVILYWVHNSTDSSSQTYAKLELTINGETTVTEIQNSTDPATRDLTSQYTFNTSQYAEGSVLTWRVCTKGALNEYGEWSAMRQVTIYASPTVVFDTGTYIPSTFSSFPMIAIMTASPAVQSVMVFTLAIFATESYQTEDYAGRDMWVNAGDTVFVRSYIPTSNSLTVQINAGDVYLENGYSYRIEATASMDSGLTATTSRVFEVSWEGDDVFLDAEIGINTDRLTASIRPYAYIDTVDEDDEPVQEEQTNYLFSVFRREFDGSFHLVAANVDAAEQVTVLDPHPALDEARYRISAKNKTTGQTTFYDLPGIAIDEPAIVLQWDESWRNYGSEIDDVDDDPANPLTTGSMLKLPYNVDVQDKYSPDVTYANYIGREHPVSYYGTQQGHKATWNTEIPADDVNTIYALRRLAVYRGDVYVREPSGTGYWANVNVSFSLKHLAVTVPVTLDITRVVGGVLTDTDVNSADTAAALVGDVTMYVDNNGNLVYDRDTDTQVDFYLRNGYLLLESTE